MPVFMKILPLPSPHYASYHALLALEMRNRYFRSLALVHRFGLPPVTDSYYPLTGPALHYPAGTSTLKLRKPDDMSHRSTINPLAHTCQMNEVNLVHPLHSFCDLGADP